MSSKLSRLSLLNPLEGVTFVASVTTLGFAYEWMRFRGRGVFEAWRGEKQLHKISDELDRKKKESREAYLEAISREIAMLKLKLSKRKLADWEVDNCEREIVVLKSKVFAWTSGEGDVTAPQERSQERAT